MRLVGIARLAAESSVLESKSTVEYRELESRRWIGRCSGVRMPFGWTINPYRGCEFACRYCFARYTHEFMELSPGEDFETRIFAKKWSSSAFATELRRIPPGDSIAIGTATDPYQPAERRYGLTRRMLEVFAQDYGRRIYLITKSDLVQRDVDLMVEINRRNRMEVSVTVTTMDRDLARLLEPKAPRPDLRIGAVAALAKAGVPVNTAASPVVPEINDGYASLDAVARAAKAAGARRFHASVLFLKPAPKEVFMAFIEQRFPQLLPTYQGLFENGAFLRGEYPLMIRERVESIRRANGFVAIREDNWQPYDPQLPLFAADALP